MSTPTASAPPARSGRGRTIAVAAVLIIVFIVAAYLLYPSSSTPGKSVVNIANGTGSNQSLNFNPSTITVVIGMNNTVVFTNHDVTEHTVTFMSGPSGVSLTSISDSNLAAGTNYTVTLSTAGTYHYKCTIHAWMSGTIIVESS
jgi:plastocyanin